MRQETLSLSVGQLVRMIDDGVIGLPNFQRDFVWPPSQVAALLDSVAREWPIGTLLLVPPVAELAMRPIAGAPTLRRDGVRYLVLDGQQRLTALYQAISGVGEYGFSLNRARSSEKDQLFEWGAEFAGTQLSARDQLNRLANYNVPCVVLGSHIEIYELAQIFEAINTPGVPIDVFDLANARAGAVGRDLRESWDELREAHSVLTDFRVSPLEVLRLVALNAVSAGVTAVRGLRASDLLDIPPDEIANAWPNAIKGYAYALTLLVEHAGVVEYADLPSSRAALLTAAVLPRGGVAVAIDTYWNFVLRPEEISDADVLNAVRYGNTIRTQETARFSNTPLERLSRGGSRTFTRAVRGLARINGARDPIDGGELEDRELREFEYHPGYGIVGPATMRTELAQVLYLSTSSATSVRVRLRAATAVPDFALDRAALASQGFDIRSNHVHGRHETLLRWLRGVVSEIV